MRSKRSFSSLVVLSLLLLLFQNCGKLGVSNVQFTLIEKSNSQGDGQVFDGKIIVLHHYEEGFACEGIKSPKSILTRKSSGEWSYTENALDKCEYIKEKSVQTVLYDSLSNTATMEGQSFFAPLPLIVDAFEPPNLPDINVLDGVCQNSNRKCSLQAALDQAGVIAESTEATVHVSSGTYVLSKNLDLIIRHENDRLVYLLGDSSGTSVIDGANSTYHLRIQSESLSPVVIRDIRFQNGVNMSGLPDATSSIHFGKVDGSGVTNRGTSLQLNRCNFTNNYGAPAVYLGPDAGNLYAKDSSFYTPGSTSILIDGADSLQVENSYFFAGMGGIEVRNNIGNVNINNVVFNSTYNGLVLHDCKTCRFDNLTFFHTMGSGLVVHTTRPDNALTSILRNATFFDAGFATYPSIHLNLTSPSIFLMYSTAIGYSGNFGTITSCQNASVDPGTFAAFYSVFQDGGCGQSGTGNQTNVPSLGFTTTSLISGVGIMPHMMPGLGSPLIDNGHPINCPTEDMNRNPRPVGKTAATPVCDVGAIEVQ